jgi:hypothetical protein
MGTCADSANFRSSTAFRVSRDRDGPADLAHLSKARGLPTVIIGTRKADRNLPQVVEAGNEMG